MVMYVKRSTKMFGYRPYQFYLLWYQVSKFLFLTILPLLEVTSLLKMEYFGIESLQKNSIETLAFNLLICYLDF